MIVTVTARLLRTDLWSGTSLYITAPIFAPNHEHSLAAALIICSHGKRPWMRGRASVIVWHAWSLVLPSVQAHRHRITEHMRHPVMAAGENGTKDDGTAL